MCDEQRARPLSLLDLVRELFEKARTTSYSCDLNTLGGQPFYDRAADADAHFGNQRRLSDKLQIHDPYPQISRRLPAQS